MATYTGTTARGAEYTMTSPTQIIITIAGHKIPGTVKLVGSVLTGTISRNGRGQALQAELTDDEASIVGAWIAEETERIAATPEAIAKRLRAERDALVRQLPSDRDAEDAFDTQWARGNEREAFAAKETALSANASKRAEVLSMIAEFDASHPEVKAEIDAEREQRTDTAMWQ